MNSPSNSLPIDALRSAFRGAAAGGRFDVNASLASYTTARAGGAADVLLIANTADELAQAATRLWEMEVPFHVLGVGSNVLVSDSGVRGVTILNRARAIVFAEDENPPAVWAESGALIGTIARQAALKGLSGFEWAATVPGTLGGAVYGNAGAFGGDMQSNLMVAEILHPHGKELWPVEQMRYEYRSSILKREQGRGAVILAARLKLQHSISQAVQEKMDGFAAQRRRTQPPGANMGSMFKNPPGDYAGRLIEAAGLKGARIGDAEISTVHANFFINLGNASAEDIGKLIRLARETVAQKFGVRLELEVELLGDWSTVLNDTNGANGAGNPAANADSGAHEKHER